MVQTWNELEDRGLSRTTVKAQVSSNRRVVQLYNATDRLRRRRPFEVKICTEQLKMASGDPIGRAVYRRAVLCGGVVLGSG